MPNCSKVSQVMLYYANTYATHVGDIPTSSASEKYLYLTVLWKEFKYYKLPFSGEILNLYKCGTVDRNSIDLQVLTCPWQTSSWTGHLSRPATLLNIQRYTSRTCSTLHKINLGLLGLPEELKFWWRLKFSRCIEQYENLMKHCFRYYPLTATCCVLRHWKRRESREAFPLGTDTLHTR